MGSTNNAGNLADGDLQGERGAGSISVFPRLRAGVRTVARSIKRFLAKRGAGKGACLSDDQGICGRAHNRFEKALERISRSPYYRNELDDGAPAGYYEGRHIITHNGRINGGVYLGAIAHEAVVVDEKYGALNSLYNELILRFARENVKRDCLEERIFKQAVQLAREKLPLNPEGVRALAFKNRIKPDRKAALDFYVKEKKAAPRHQVLLAGYFLEKLKTRGLIDGTISIDPSFTELPAEDEKLVFTTSRGANLTFDPCNYP